jgi:hypothetical protein
LIEQEKEIERFPVEGFTTIRHIFKLSSHMSAGPVTLIVLSNEEVAYDQGVVTLLQRMVILSIAAQ